MEVDEDIEEEKSGLIGAVANSYDEKNNSSQDDPDN